MAKTKSKKEYTGPPLLKAGDLITEKTYLSMDGGKTWVRPARGKHLVGTKLTESQEVTYAWTNEPPKAVSK